MTVFHRDHLQILLIVCNLLIQAYFSCCQCTKVKKEYLHKQPWLEPSASTSPGMEPESAMNLCGRDQLKAFVSSMIHHRKKPSPCSRENWPEN